MHSSSHYIKIKGLKKEDNEHYFELDWERVSEPAFNWKLIKISPSEYEFEGKIKQTIKFLFIDDTAEHYQLDSSYNWISRGLLNTLLWYIDWIKKQWYEKGKINLELSLYLNKEWYKQMWVRINQERSNWRFSIEKQKEMIETILNKKGEFVSNDYSWYDEVLKNWIQEIQDFILIDDFFEPKKEVIEIDEKISTWLTQDEIDISQIPW